MAKRLVVIVRADVAAELQKRLTKAPPAKLAANARHHAKGEAKDSLHSKPS